jgi:hypothetical protein
VQGGSNPQAITNIVLALNDSPSGYDFGTKSVDTYSSMTCTPNPFIAGSTVSCTVVYGNNGSMSAT